MTTYLYAPTPLCHSISHFRCEVATPIEGCDELAMSEHVADTRINTEGGGTVDTNSYLLTDLKRDAFQPDIACAFYLPPVAGYCWQLYLIKNLAIDHIVTGNPCDCQCEDSVLFEQVDSQSRKVQRFCDFVPDGGAQREGWCDHVYGPDNVQGLQPYSAGKDSARLPPAWRPCQQISSFTRSFIQTIL